MCACLIFSPVLCRISYLRLNKAVGVGDGSVGEGILWYVALIQMRLILADHTCTKPLDCQH